MTCALVPEMPNEETPARHGRSDTGSGVASEASRTAPDSQFTCDDGRCACRVAGRTPWRIARTILITPATPAAAWV
ncbi:hypothetical protein Aco03nite_052440 [Actinoplanes couchii]|uniref:Uncharacterized protein n=1 Tax=Actinoplanes couchii TaxID=403638 RepID=A0ABQ3XEC4_9ACTN|nr:hypothetical protein Aco03nite_052440 [Actinoplanes couchii]